MFFERIPVFVDVFLVGGAARDMLRGLETPRDFDFIITGVSDWTMIPGILTELGCEGLPQKHGTDFVLDDVNKLAKAKHPDLGVVDFKLVPNLMEDLKDRDFTINAIAIDCRSGQIIDPCMGQMDLRNQLLIPCNNTCFLKSPERLFRALRFQAKGFTLTNHIHALAAQPELLEVIEQANGDRMAQQADKMLRDGHIVVIFSFFAEQPKLAQAIFGDKLQLRTVLK